MNMLKTLELETSGGTTQPYSGNGGGWEPPDSKEEIQQKEYANSLPKEVGHGFGSEFLAVLFAVVIILFIVRKTRD
ncbi:hypothetical protein [Shewanella sp.]|uniref:hypothetical protein n=1 Tax=Shewanella sp. TaxID=50422 RepID=UPI003A84ECCC